MGISKEIEEIIIQEIAKNSTCEEYKTGFIDCLKLVLRMFDEKKDCDD